MILTFFTSTISISYYTFQELESKIETDNSTNSSTTINSLGKSEKMDPYPILFILLPLMLLSISISWFFCAFAGFQDSQNKQSMYSLFLITPFFIFPILTLDLPMINFGSSEQGFSLINFLEINLIPILSFISTASIGVISIWFTYSIIRKKRSNVYNLRMRSDPWHTFFSFRTSNFLTQMVIFLCIYLIMESFALILTYISKFSLTGIIFSTIIIILTLLILLKPISKNFSLLIIENLFGWNKFMNTYSKNRYSKNLNSVSSLSLIYGKCIAICIDENLEEKYTYFSQQFIIENKDFKFKQNFVSKYFSFIDPIEVILLKEFSPFTDKKKFVVEEGDEIKIFGEVRHHFKNEQISPLIIAYHIEPYKD